MNSHPINATGLDKGMQQRVHIGVASLRIVWTLLPVVKPPWLLDRETTRNVGRFRIGDQVTIFTRCIPGGIPLQPQAPGPFRIYGGAVGVRHGRLPVESTDNGNIGIFRGKFVSDNSDHIGRYIGLIAFNVGLVKPVEECFFFELIPGGHQLGAILALFGVERPTGTTVLAGCESGKITQGHLPYLDEGV